MAMQNVKPVHEFFLEHLRMETAQLKDKETEEEGKQKKVERERIKK